LNGSLTQSARVSGESGEISRNEIVLGIDKKVTGKGLWSRIGLPYTTGECQSFMYRSSIFSTINEGERKGECDMNPLSSLEAKDYDRT
jgi:hypothetical protein